MPWELTVVKIDERNGTRIPLANKVLTRSIIEDALPGSEWQDGLPPRQMIEMLEKTGMDPTTLEMMNRPKLQGSFDGDEFSLEFYGFEGEPLMQFHIDVRGNGDPLPALVAICEKEKWTILDPNRKPIDLAVARSKSWAAFKSWRDRAISQISSDNVKRRQ